ncbi:MAG TPA: serine/threonine-protein kinase, partial [Verrucomicrobiae bacterium]|nr:serine/threonine-protein kinase [Verrucomicrobiae bacterium]
GPGTVIGRYKLLEKIGEGGFGIVYMAEQREPVKRKVALKIIKPGMDTRQVVARFEAERQALALMDHPHIAKVLDAGATDTGRPYFVMELVRGMPITKFCDENQATTEERLELFMAVCSAIQHAHQKGVIHRDIKPNNVLITMHDDRPVPKVIDFGIAKATQQELTDKTIFTRYHEFLGTPAYMSPEQTQLSGLDIDTRTDIYSLGVLLYELLTGHTPFDAQELLSGGYDEMRSRIRDQEPIKPSTKLNTLSVKDRALAARKRRSDPKHLSRLLRGDLDWIVMKALEKDRARRYESASAFAQDIRRYLSDEPAMAVAPSFGYRLRKFARRHRRALPVAGAFTALLLLATAVSSRLAWQARREAARARTEASTAEAVTRFLNEDLFAMARPEYEPESEITLRSLLDRASQELPGALATQPLVAAAIHGTLGRAYGNIGRHDAADQHLQKALSLYQHELGERHEKTLRAMLEVARGLEARGYTTPALPVAEKARELAQAEFGPDHPLTIQCLDRLAWNYGLLKRRHESLQAATQAWQTAQRVLPSPETAVYSSLYLLARQHGREGRFEQGEAMLRQAWHAHEMRLGTNHARTFRTYTGLAAYYLDHRQKLDEAERLNLNALDAQRRLFGEGHRSVLTVRGNLALLYEVSGRFSEALTQIVPVLEWNPENKGYVRDVARLLSHSALPSLESVARERRVTWRFSDRPGPPAWRAIHFDDARWVTDFPTNAFEVAARCLFELTAAPNFGLAVKIKGDGNFDLFINGAPAISAVVRGDDGFQFAVCPRESLRALEVGTNVITLHGRSLAAGPVPSIELLVTSPPTR